MLSQAFILSIEGGNLNPTQLQCYNRQWGMGNGTKLTEISCDDPIAACEKAKAAYVTPFTSNFFTPESCQKACSDCMK